MEPVSEQILQVSAAVCLLMSLVLVGSGAFWSSRFPACATPGAMLLIAAIAIFSMHWTVGLAAVFIIAITFTDSDFLHTLAAIVRGGPDYFKFKIEQMTNHERRGDVAKEILEAQTSVVVNSSEAWPDTSKSGKGDNEKIDIDGLIAIDEFAITWLENKLSIPFQRGIRSSRATGPASMSFVTVDGLTDNARIAVKVQLCRSSSEVTSFIRRLLENGKKIQVHFGEQCAVVLMAIAPDVEVRDLILATLPSFEPKGFSIFVLTVDELKSALPAHRQESV